LNPLQLKL